MYSALVAQVIHLFKTCTGFWILGIIFLVQKMLLLLKQGVTRGLVRGENCTRFLNLQQLPGRSDLNIQAGRGLNTRISV